MTADFTALHPSQQQLLTCSGVPPSPGSPGQDEQVVLLVLAGESLGLVWGGPLLDELCGGALGVQALAQVASGLALVHPAGLAGRVALEAAG